MPMLPNLMPELDQLLSALFLVALLLYLIPIAIAVVASVIWFTR
jgi:uncharacterized membrane protein YbhN (UPF0104 family)